MWIPHRTLWNEKLERAPPCHGTSPALFRFHVNEENFYVLLQYSLCGSYKVYGTNK